MAVKNPLIIELISKLGLKAEPYTEDEKMDNLHNFLEISNTEK